MPTESSRLKSELDQCFPRGIAEELADFVQALTGKLGIAVAKSASLSDIASSVLLFVDRLQTDLADARGDLAKAREGRGRYADAVGWLSETLGVPPLGEAGYFDVADFKRRAGIGLDHHRVAAAGAHLRDVARAVGVRSADSLDEMKKGLISAFNARPLRAMVGQVVISRDEYDRLRAAEAYGAEAVKTAASLNESLLRARDEQSRADAERNTVLQRIDVVENERNNAIDERNDAHRRLEAVKKERDSIRARNEDLLGKLGSLDTTILEVAVALGVRTEGRYNDEIKADILAAIQEFKAGPAHTGGVVHTNEELARVRELLAKEAP